MGRNWWMASALDVVHPEGKDKGKANIAEISITVCARNRGIFRMYSKVYGVGCKYSSARWRNHHAKKSRALARCHHLVGSQSWKARLHHQFVLLATSTTTGPTVTRYWMATMPRTVTDRLQRILNAAARVVSGTRKVDQPWPNCYSPSYTGSTFLNVSSTNLE